MTICKKCDKEFDPALDFVEDTNLIEFLMHRINIYHYCSDCMYDLDEHIKKSIKSFLNLKK